MTRNKENVKNYKKEDIFLELLDLVSEYKKNKSKNNEDKIRKFLRDLESEDETFLKNFSDEKGKIEPYLILYAYVNAYLLAKAYFIIGELDQLPIINPDNDEVNNNEKN